MSVIKYDLIIIGSGISGLYSALIIKKLCPQISFLILEKYKKKWIGGRTSSELFHGSQIVTGAGIGRKDTNPLLIKLLKQLHIKVDEYKSQIDYSKVIKPVNILIILKKLKTLYLNHPELHKCSFKHFFTKTLGEKLYKQFVLSSGYSDFENADTYETLFNYGMEDNASGWTGFHVPWKMIVDKLYHLIGTQHFKFSSEVTSIIKNKINPCKFDIFVNKEKKYLCSKVIVATNIIGIQKLINQNITNNYKIYSSIKGQPFLRLYAKFDKKSSIIMNNFITNYTIVPGPLQKIIPINKENGIYMIAYSDNNNAIILKKYLENTLQNRTILATLVENSLGIKDEKLKILDIKDFYWPIGTHYYLPLNSNFKNRDYFLNIAQHPEKNILVVGEAVSRYQGWVEGALESVKNTLNKKWLEEKC